MKKVILSDDWFLRIFKCFFVLCLSFFMIRLVIYAVTIVATPVPVEYREGAFLLSTEFLLQGINPYSVENHPLSINVYGLVYNLAVLPFAALFGNTLSVHRALSVLCVLLACALITHRLLLRDASLLFAISGGMILMASLLFHVTPVTRPDALGFLLFLLAVLISEHFGFNRSSLVWSAFLGVLAFFTKQYFLLSLGIVASFVFLFVSKAKGIIYLLGAAVVIVVVLTLLQLTGEYYLLDTILHHIFLAGGSTSMMVSQLIYFSLVYSPILIILAITLIERKLLKTASSTSGLEDKTVSKSGFKLDISHLNKPLLSFHVDLSWWAFLITTLAVVFSLGQHLNNYVVYLFQLMTPFLVIGVFQYLGRQKKLYPFLAVLALTNLYIINAYVLYPNHPQQYQANWNRIIELTGQGEHILNSPAIAPLLIEQGKQIVDSGENEYFYATRPYPPLVLLPGYEEVVQRGQDYLNDVEAGVRKKGYDLVIITENYSPFISVAVLQNYYTYVETITVNMPQTDQQWSLQVWIPKK